MSDLPPTLAVAAHRWFGKAPENLTDHQRRALERALARKTLSRNTNLAFDSEMTFGQRLADHVASFGGSWKFIILFGVFLGLWVALNLVLARAAFDPYPFIFLNLMLSMLAAIQAPVIMMSQNRQSAQDRRAAEHDYVVNLRAELEIMHLHDKMDAMRNLDLARLIEAQNQTIELLNIQVAKLAEQR